MDALRRACSAEKGGKSARPPRPARGHGRTTRTRKRAAHRAEGEARQADR